MSEYKDIDAVNQSSLKKILTHPQLYLSAKNKQNNSEQSEAAHFVFGRAVDIMLVGTKDEFEEQFVRIPDETKCSEAVKVIIDDIFNTIGSEKTKNLEAYPVEILGLARLNKYRDNYKDDTLIATVVKEGSAYFELLKTTFGKTPITETEYAKAVNCKMAIKADQYTQKYCQKVLGTEFLDRFIVQFEHKGTNIKGEIDRVVINHNTKEITPIDFKTTALPIYTFNTEFWKYRYDFQAATYHRGLIFHPKINKLIEDGYKLNTFKYIVVEKELHNRPMVFNVSEEIDLIGLVGGERSTYKVEGFYSALKRYQFHQENDKWDFPMEYYQKGEIDIRV